MLGKILKVDDFEVYLSKHATPSREAVLVIHEWWGLNAEVKETADRFAEEGYVAVAIDLFNGQVTEDRVEAGKQMDADEPALSMKKLARVLDFMRTSIEVEAERVGTVGFCFGGGYSLKCALQFPELVQASVIYYGSLDSDAETFRTCRVPLLGIFAERDTWITPKMVRDFEADARREGVPFEAHTFPAEHAFFNKKNKVYDEKFAREAWAITLDFFNLHLKGKAAQ